MRFCLIHIDDHGCGPDEEAFVIVPGAAKTAMAVPIDALPGFLSLLAEATQDLPPAICTGCGCALPGHPAP
jgi:hypothetical protein